MKKIVTITAILLIPIIMLCACSNSEKIKTGTYINSDASVYGHSGVVLSDENNFIFYFDGLSYCPTGNYSIEGDTLTLTVNDKEVYLFMIKDDELIFESGEWAEKMIDKGTVFQLSNE